MKLLSKTEALSRAKETTEECHKTFKLNPKPIKGEIKQNLFKLFTSAMSELALADSQSLVSCSSVAIFVNSKVAEKDRQKFLDILERGLTLLEAYNYGKLPNLTDVVAINLSKAQSVQQVVDAVCAELANSKSQKIINNESKDTKIVLNGRMY